MSMYIPSRIASRASTISPPSMTVREPVPMIALAQRLVLYWHGQQAVSSSHSSARITITHVAGSRPILRAL